MAKVLNFYKYILAALLLFSAPNSSHAAVDADLCGSAHVKGAMAQLIARTYLDVAKSMDKQIGQLVYSTAKQSDLENFFGELNEFKDVGLSGPVYFNADYSSVFYALLFTPTAVDDKVKTVDKDGVSFKFEETGSFLGKPENSTLTINVNHVYSGDKTEFGLRCQADISIPDDLATQKIRYSALFEEKKPSGADTAGTVTYLVSYSAVLDDEWISAMKSIISTTDTLLISPQTFNINGGDEMFPQKFGFHHFCKKSQSECYSLFCNKRYNCAFFNSQGYVITNIDNGESIEDASDSFKYVVKTLALQNNYGRLVVQRLSSRDIEAHCESNILTDQEKATCSRRAISNTPNEYVGMWYNIATSCSIAKKSGKIYGDSIFTFKENDISNVDFFCRITSAVKQNGLWTIDDVCSEETPNASRYEQHWLLHISGSDMTAKMSESSSGKTSIMNLKKCNM
jgi:hypothetical protein